MTSTNDTATATTPLAQMIDPTGTLHLRSSDAHILLDALTGNLMACDAKAARELVEALAKLTTMADESDVVEALAVTAERHAAANSTR